LKVNFKQYPQAFAKFQFSVLTEITSVIIGAFPRLLNIENLKERATHIQAKAGYFEMLTDKFILQ